MKVLCVLFLLFWSLQLSAASDKYPASAIPEELKTASDAIVRLQDQQLTILENGNIRRHELIAITVMNERGENVAYFYGPYDRYTKLKGVIGRVYNAEGELVETLRGEDVVDVSMISSSSLYDDGRIKIIQPEHHSYPYTVEYNIDYQLKSFLELPDWRIYPDYHVAIERAAFSVISPGINQFRFLMRNMDLEPVIAHTDKGEIYTWSVSHMPAIVDESLSGLLHDVSPMLLIGPNEFNYGGTSGNMSSWNDFGNWIWSLGEDKRELSPEEVLYVQELVSETDDPREKVSMLYKYLQNKVRYVNLKLGIGGFEPIDASTVSDHGYGDCKALSNYMCALLKATGIDSRYALVMAGKSPPEFIKDFPSQQFNHVIVAVPLKNDTMWLECTSQRLPAGYLGSFTDNRDVLLVSENGGELSRTPGFDASDNALINITTCQVEESLEASVNYSKSYLGINFGSMQSFINTHDREEQKRSIQDDIKLSAFSISDFDYDIRTEPEMVVLEHASIYVDQMISQEGDFIALQPGIFSEELGLPGRSRNRKLPVVIRRGFVRQDSVNYILPGNLDVHLLPDPVLIETEFGKFESRLEARGEDLEYYRYFILYDGIYPPEKFRNLYSFLRKVNAADNREVLLIRK